MTTGTVVIPAPMARAFANSWPYSGLPQELGMVIDGTQSARSWSGGDSPPGKRGFDIIYHHLPGWWKKVPRYRKKTPKRKVPPPPTLHISGPAAKIPYKGKKVKRKRAKKPKKVFKEGELYFKLVWVKPRTYSKKKYHDKLPRKHREPHAYTCVRTVIESSPYTSYSYVLDTSVYPYVSGRLENYSVQGSYEQFGTGFAVEPLWTANDDIALLGKLRERIAGTSFNMGVALAEASMSLEMIGRTASTLATSLRRLKRGDVAGAARALGVNYGHKHHIPRGKMTADELSARWLELQYGWLPLLGDVHDAAGFLATRLEQPKVQRYRARVRVPSKVTKSGAPFIWSKCEAYTGKQIVAYLTEVTESKLVGLQDPASIAWELTPWSFVVDWFIPIGNYLQAIALTGALKGTYVTTTRTVVNTSFGNFRDVPSQDSRYPWTTVYPGGGPHCVTKSYTCTRTVSTVLDVPLPKFKSFKESLSWKRAVNAVSLVTQAVLGGSSSLSKHGYN